MLIFVASRNNTFFEISNHLGNVHLVLSDYRSITGDGDDYIIGYHSSVSSASEYYPFGMLLVEGEYDSESYRYGFQGQEMDNEIKGTGNSINFKYRMHDPRIGRFFAVDPIAAKFPYNSPYAFSENRLIDGFELEGLQWEPVKDDNEKVIDYNWVGDDGRDEDGELKDGIVEAGVIFWGSNEESLGENDNLFGEGASIAKVVVYGPAGPDDIEEYGGYTMSSDPSKYGVVAEGTYNVSYDVVGKSGILKSHWAIENRGRVPAKGGENPAFPEREPGYLIGVFIHRSNNSGYAGGNVSRGCPLIVPSYNNDNPGWDEFNNQLKGVSGFQMTIHRDYEPPKSPGANFNFIIYIREPIDKTYVHHPYN